MVTTIATIHILVSFFLIALVLLQDPKSSGTGGVLGGGGANSILGATGGASLLTKVTRYTAIAFGVTCMSLTLMSKPQTGSVIDSAPAAASSSRPAAQPPAEEVTGDLPATQPSTTAPATTEGTEENETGSSHP